MKGRSSELKFGKPEPRARLKARRDRLEAAQRKECCRLVLNRESDLCQRCGRFVSYDFDVTDDRRAHVNEMVPKSLGGSWCDPEDLSNLELLCGGCHMPNGRHAPTRERMVRILDNFKEN